ncbi:MAG: hypothetical protein ACYCO0_02765 [Candidatus Micrarchaeaceae archaeon]
MSSKMLNASLIDYRYRLLIYTYGNINVVRKNALGDITADLSKRQAQRGYIGNVVEMQQEPIEPVLEGWTFRHLPVFVEYGFRDLLFGMAFPILYSISMAYKGYKHFVYAHNHLNCVLHGVERIMQKLA